MDFIKLLDVANPKKIKDTINLLIENYEDFGDTVQAIADKAAEDSAAALLAGNEAKQIAQQNTTDLEQAIAEQNTNIENAIATQDSIIAQNTITSNQAKQIAEDALAMIEQADARSQAATETAEDAIELASDAVETSELAMNVAIDAKSSVDQAISTGVFGTFVHNPAGISLLHAYMTDNLNQENTAENFYMATPKLVRDALEDYYTKATIDELEVELNGKFNDYYTKTEINTSLGNKVDKIEGKQLSTNDYTTDEKNKLAGIEAGAEVNPPLYISTGQNTNGGMTQKAVTDAIPTTLAQLNEDVTHRLVTDIEKETWNAKQSSLTEEQLLTLHNFPPYINTNTVNTFADIITSGIYAVTLTTDAPSEVESSYVVFAQEYGSGYATYIALDFRSDNAWFRRKENNILSDWKSIINPNIDSALSETSENPVQNKVITEALNALQSNIPNVKQITQSDVNGWELEGGLYTNKFISSSTGLPNTVGFRYKSSAAIPFNVEDILIINSSKYVIISRNNIYFGTADETNGTYTSLYYEDIATKEEVNIVAEHIGKWTPLYIDFAGVVGRATNSAFTATKATADISTVIPNYVEGAQYELLVRVATYATSSTGAYYWSDVTSDSLDTVASLYTSSDSRHCKQQTIIPVERYLYWQKTSGDIGTSYLEAIAYRRVY